MLNLRTFHAQTDIHATERPDCCLVLTWICVLASMHQLTVWSHASHPDLQEAQQRLPPSLMCARTDKKQ